MPITAPNIHFNQLNNEWSPDQNQLMQFPPPNVQVVLKILKQLYNLNNYEISWCE